MPAHPKGPNISNKVLTQPPKIQTEPGTSPVSSIDPAAQEQFESELIWCIKQLQIALGSGKLNDKQLKDHTKALNALMSDRSPVVKKRQVMRLSFGDYRAKMAEDEKKISKGVSNIKIGSATPNKQSVFRKKSAWPENSQKDFQFNFQIDERAESMEPSQENPTKEQMKNGQFHFHRSNNSFLFNFEVNDSNS